LPQNRDRETISIFLFQSKEVTMDTKTPKMPIPWPERLALLELSERLGIPEDKLLAQILRDALLSRLGQERRKGEGAAEEEACNG
jgi:hypothetical protein